MCPSASTTVQARFPQFDSPNPSEGHRWPPTRTLDSLVYEVLFPDSIHEVCSAWAEVSGLDMRSGDAQFGFDSVSSLLTR